MGRRSFGNSNCEQIYPTGARKTEIADSATIAFRMTREQAIDLATNLLKAARESDRIDITGFRARNLITVTSDKTRT